MSNHFPALRDAFLREWAAPAHQAVLPAGLVGCAMTVGGPMAGSGSLEVSLCRNVDCVVVAQWTAAPFPGCATLVVTTGAWLHESLRGQHLGSCLRRFREMCYRIAGFAGEVCTVRLDNVAQRHVMRRAIEARSFPSEHGGGYVLCVTDLVNPIAAPTNPVTKESL